jgi:hypothetical protein
MILAVLEKKPEALVWAWFDPKKESTCVNNPETSG